MTSAGVAAALNCCLHLVHQGLGADVAARRARRMVLAPHRAGSQAQFIPAPVPASDSGDPVEQVARLSGFATAVSLRHHFAKSLGTSPRHYRAEFNALPQAV